MTQFENIVYQAVKISISPKIGLSLLTFPTGSGKSHNIAEVLADNIIEGSPRKTIIVSPQIKLLGDLVEKIEKKCNMAGISSPCLVIKAKNFHWMSFFFDDRNLKLILTEINKITENKYKCEELAVLCKTLHAKYKKYQSLSKSSQLQEDEMDSDDDLLKIRDKLSRELIKLFVKKFRQDNGSYEEQCHSVLVAYPFLEKLFPELSFYKYKVIVVTSSKLHKPVTSGLIKDGVIPYWEHIPSGSLVIIDESDLCKETALNELVSNSISGTKTVDKWGLVYKLCNNIEKLNSYFHADYEEPLRVWRRNLMEKLNKCIKYLLKEFKIHEHLDGSLLEATDRGGSIYHDRDSIFTNTSNLTHVYSDVAHNTDYLCSSAEEEASCLPITFIDARLNIVLNEYIRIVNDSINEYHDACQAVETDSRSKSTRSLRVSDFTAFCQIFNYLNLSPDEIRFLSNQKGQNIFYAPSNLATEKISNKNSIYYKGVSITDIGTMYGSVRNCNLSSIRLNIFPENVILQLIKEKNCMIMLSSATADIKDPIHNYDLEYLAEELGENWYGTKLLSREMKDQLAKYFDSVSAHPSVKFEVWDQECSDWHHELQQLLGNSKALTEAEAFLSSMPHMKAPLINVLKFYSEFIKNSEQRAALYVTPYIWPKKYFKSIDGEQSEQKFLRLFSQIRKHILKENIGDVEHDENTESIYSQLNIAFLSGKAFSKGLRYVIEKLSKYNDSKIICFITYGSGTVGVNYEYKIEPEAENICHAAKQYGISKKCNFDSIYIEHPSNFIVGDDVDPSSYNSACIHLSLLEEAAQLSVKNKKSFIAEFLRRKMQLEEYGSEVITDNPLVPRIKHLVYQTKAYREFCISRIIQALGRITRTPNSRNKINIILDGKCAEAISKSRLPESATWLYKLIKSQCPSYENIEEEDCKERGIRFDRLNFDIDKKIEYLTRRAITPIGGADSETKDEILRFRKDVNELNEWVMMHPVMESIEGIDQRFAELYYDTELFGAKTHPADAVSLNKLVSSPIIKEYLKSRSYETIKKEFRYQLLPCVIQQLYVGRMGEHVFKALISTEGVNVEPMSEDLYEAADWVCDGKVFVDVKFWSESLKERETRLSNWSKKIKRCGEGRYIIVNVPLKRNFNSLKQSLAPSHGEPAFINGLVNIKTGKIISENLNSLVDFIKK